MDKLLDQILRHLQHGGITVTYPDGRTVIYGDKTAAAKLHIRFKTAAALAATVRNPSLGFGDGFMRGDITFEAGFFEELMSVLGANKREMTKWFNLPVVRQLLNASNVKSRQKSNISHHYDLGNDFYKLWLDDSMTYSCAYFRTPQDTLEAAQTQKRRYILRKLNLERGMSLLDIGSGWGSLLIMAAREYGVSGLGVTLSEEQLKHSRLAACEAGVDHLVKFELTNFQDLPAAGHLFDRVLSVGMFEHVGRAGMAAYFDVVARLLKPAGVTLLHTISTIDTHGGNDAWMDKYIFPGGYIPAVREIIDLLPRHDLRPIDYESLRLHYALTLDEWLRRYELHAAEVRAERGDQFYRMWQMYLTTCAGNFRSGGLDLSQFVMVKGLNNSLPLTREYLYRD